ncbi:Acetyltransferase (GNAT) family protein [Burkholderia sp. WP9]|uniref:GNAT family N-acetyltransferase n=1 Tax=Burkholderia sp. WP9 TaxID=1500263 RepID=UPI0008992E87|nr:GNAT family N-acetyltransferase [Burkholderia sp. WP9]SEF11873.1 Acetyltransferase (GNAT) family protein [Burkholderia sp. WP9]
MSTVLNAAYKAVEIVESSKPASGISGLRCRRARIEDAVQCAPLIYASGEHEFDYFLGVPPGACIAFLESAFRSSAGRFSYRRHYVAADSSGAVLGILAAHDGCAILWDDPHIVWALVRFFGVRRAVGMLLRGVVLESELPKPRRNQLLMAHCATVARARSRGVFSALFQHAIETGMVNLDNGKQLVLDVLISNQPARALYERLGFAPAAAGRMRSRRLPAALQSTRMQLDATPGNREGQS